mmetsp:Transcript_35242/g.78311  ORF Transcript_35242/g.78311 Transcript_35242/m.78311 type:complete len:140 (+) Transcript_35242:174-593(+)
MAALASESQFDLWAVHQQIKFNDELDIEGIVVKQGGANHGMSFGGFYRSKASADDASKVAFYAYMKKTFDWKEAQVQENINPHLLEDFGQEIGDNGLYYWEGETTRKVWRPDGEGDQEEVEVEAYAVISFSAFAVIVSD